MTAIAQGTTMTDDAEGQTLQPTWLFYGHSSDERTTFVLRAPAVEDRTKE